MSSARRNASLPLMRCPMIKGFSFANENQREMRQWGKIAARAHGTLFRHDWMNSSIEEARQHLDDRLCELR